MSQARRTRHFAQSDSNAINSNTINVDAISLKKIERKNSFSQWFITRWNTSKLVKNTPLRVVFSTLFSVFHLVMKHGVSCGLDTHYVKIRNLLLGSVILCRGSRSQSRLQAVSYFCLQSYCTRDLSTRAAKPGAARNEGVSPRRKNYLLVSIPYCNNNVVVCSRAGWDKN